MPIRSTHRANNSGAAASCAQVIHNQEQLDHHPAAHFHAGSVGLSVSSSKEEGINMTNNLHPIIPGCSVKCSGCQMPIFDRYIMTVLDGQGGWHQDCLRCSQCKFPLQDKCFFRNDKLFCRDDFFRLFGTQCKGCSEGICPNDLVRRTPRGDVYHLKCFICAMCRKQLSTGEELYIISDYEFVCKDDYLTKHKSPSSLTSAPCEILTAKTEPTSPISSSPTGNYQVKSEEPDQHDQVSTTCKASDMAIKGLRISDVRDEDEDDSKMSEDGVSHRRNSLPLTDGDCCDKDTKSVGDNSSIAESETRNDENNVSTKRRGPRTTIKAKQLELLKTAFAATPKPTRHIREQLAQETGLTMRVIQVWFQNRRSKERRMKQLTAMGSGRRNMFRPRRSGVRSLREFDGDSGDMMTVSGVAPGFNYFPDGAGSHPGDFFPPGAHGGPPPGMFEFHPYPPPGVRHAQNEAMAHFADLPGNGHALVPGSMSHSDGGHFGSSEMLSQSSTPNSLPPNDNYGHPVFDTMHPGGNGGGNGGRDSPMWQNMTMAQ